jgi:hypothetical protein
MLALSAIFVGMKRVLKHHLMLVGRAKEINALYGRKIEWYLRQGLKSELGLYTF